MKKNQKGSATTWLVVFIMIGFWVWFFNIAPLDEYEQKLKHIWGEVDLPKIGDYADSDADDSVQPELTMLPVEADAACDGSPPIGGKKFLLGKDAHQQKLHSRFFASNEHAYAVLMTFVEAESKAPFGAVYVLPNQSNQINLPVGEYQLKIQSGLDWCNANIGFNDATHIDTDKTVQIQANKVVNLRLLPFGDAPADVMLSFTNSLGMLANGKQIQGTGTLMPERVAGGHYAINGSINQVPVYFLVDTGATNVAVPAAFAKRAGITECLPYMMSTANGVVKGCRAQAEELTIGQFTLKNVTVSYHKGIPDDVFLLGMNVIGLFKMEHAGDVMKLTR